MDSIAFNPPRCDLSNFISPPWLLAISLAIVRPNPKPPVERFLEFSIL